MAKRSKNCMQRCILSCKQKRKQLKEERVSKREERQKSRLERKKIEKRNGF
jgi:hypothetical protein